MAHNCWIDAIMQNIIRKLSPKIKFTNKMEYKVLKEYAKENGFKNVSEAVSAMGSFEFRRKSRQFALSKKQPHPLKMEIKKAGCRWLVNGKKLEDCSDWEKDFMNRFFQEVRTENLIGL